MPQPETRPARSHDPTPRLTLCLATDLRGSTTAGLQLTSKKLDRFNIALVDQIQPHLDAVGLDHAVIKFTGDGWLVMSDNQEHAAPLCCLAMILARCFSYEISREAGLTSDKVPALRLAVCWGRDLEVVLPGGQRDFVGNSVRRAVRAMQLCHDNEVLIDETVKAWVQQDFATTRLDLDERLNAYPNVKMEEELVLHRLIDLRAESASDADAPVYFINTLARIGRATEADELANRISDHLQRAAEGHDVGHEELLWRWNRLLASNVDYGTARSILADLENAGLHPDVATLNALIDKAQDYRTESKWLQAMIQAGVRPNVVTFNTLIDKAKDPARIEKWLERMQQEGIQPNVITLNTLVEKAEDHATAKAMVNRMLSSGVRPNAPTYETLIEKAPDFPTARAWIEEMMDNGFEPSIEAYISLFSTDLSEIPAEELLQWYLALPFHPTKPVQRAIASYRKKGKIADAMRLALDYPHIQTSLKLIREYPDHALGYFQSVVTEQGDHPNGCYALGLALRELGKTSEAEPWLHKALDLATPGPRREELARTLETLRRQIVAPL